MKSTNFENQIELTLTDQIIKNQKKLPTVGQSALEQKAVQFNWERVVG